MILEVGKPYPGALEIRDGMATQPMPYGLVSLVHLSRFEPGDAKAFAGPLTVAVAHPTPDLPWLAIRFHKNGITLDGPVLVGHRADLKDQLASAGNTLQLVVLEGNRYTVRALRLLGLRADLVTAIKAACDQTSHMGRLQAAVLAGQRLYPYPTAVYDAADLTQTFDKGE